MSDLIYTGTIDPNECYSTQLANTNELPLIEAERINIVIASDKILKIDAVKSIFSLNPRYNHVHKSYIWFKVNSEIAEQPVGIEHGRLGAHNRIKNAKISYHTHSEEIHENEVIPTYYVAIENYFECRDDFDPHDHAFVLIEDPFGMQYERVSIGICINRSIFNKAIMNATRESTGYSKTIGEYLENEYGMNKNDWFRYIMPSDQSMNRLEQILTVMKYEIWF